MVTMIDGVLPPPPVSGRTEGPVLSLKDYAALQRAPKRAPTTRVTVRSYDVPGSWLNKLTGKQLSDEAKAYSPDHMYAEYDDGREQYIYRGGPRGAFLSARVDPARESPDYGRGERVLYRTELPGQTARQAIQPAREAADHLNRSGQPYLVFGSNSNSVIGDLTADQLGHRVGDRQTPGYRPSTLSPYLPGW
ncbi:MAG: hypothetical protein EPO51_16540 [Phenylobacterium sp.]|uniref:hypothetical protein n=1 Tax=Phenylobacterium sp. TaxID=1871053 RepID=UPI001201257D|nr:hypothetical protein [Phenylobacterium sp.]TAJ70697.1 MAG: hypothetical protein EPO51_16540 [Phenylobacterium sp.]